MREVTRQRVLQLLLGTNVMTNGNLYPLGSTPKVVIKLLKLRPTIKQKGTSTPKEVIKHNPTLLVSYYSIL